MSAYKHERFGRTITIREGEKGHSGDKIVGVKVNHLDNEAMILLEPEDAPAVALAILEAAGISGGDIPNTYLSATWNALDQYVKRAERERAERAEREAEDAKAKAYRDAIFPNAIKWEHLDEDIREAHRARYRAAREFFTREEKPAPRVLQYGDPEPDRDTKWHSERCGVLQYDTNGWKGTELPFARHWDWYSKLSFPMTEVVE